jgi:hypothetical protein
MRQSWGAASINWPEVRSSAINVCGNHAMPRPSNAMVRQLAPAEHKKFFESEVNRWTKTIKDAGIEPE